MILAKTCLTLILTLCLTAAALAADKPPVLDIWPGKVPGEKGDFGEEKMSGKQGSRQLTDVSKPTLTVYRPAKDKDSGVAVVIAPGGAYRFLAWDHEGEAVAEWLNTLGVTGVLLKYRVPRRPDNPDAALQDAQRAVSVVRSKAKEWGIDPRKIGMLGFSAGGHLTAQTSTNFDKRSYDAVDDADKENCRPDFAVVIYPGGVVDRDKQQLKPEIRVTKDTPPTFLAQSSDDPVGPENSAVLYLALKKAGVPAELHIFATGGHGYGLRPSKNPASEWPKRCEDWLRTLKVLEAAAPAKEQAPADKPKPDAPEKKTYQLGPDSLPQDGVPKGKLEGPFLFKSKVFEGTVRQYWVYVPEQYKADKPACVLVWQDGQRGINPKGALRVPTVMDNLIHKKEMPVTIGIFVTPGQRGDEYTAKGTDNPNNRSIEYDSLGDKYAKFVIDELLPEVGKKYNLTKEPAGRAIGGASSGGICAFTVAWERPQEFGKVISLIGSFTDIKGGHVYPDLVRKAEAKPIRVFLQDGIYDNRSVNNPKRDWHLQNEAMVAALKEKKYDYKYVCGEGGHSDDHGGAILPDIMRWLWRDYPGAKSGDKDKSKP